MKRMKRMEVVAGAENKHCSSAFISNEMNLLGAKIDDENTSFDSKVYSTKRLLFNIQKLRGVEKSEFEILDEFLEEILNVTSMNSMEKEKLLFNLSLSREQNHFQYKSLLQIEESKINKSRASFAMIESFDALVNASDPSTKNYLTKEFKFILKQLIDKETASSISNVSGILTKYNILSSQNDHQKKCQKMSKGMANLTRKKEILVLFGSFSPITIAHLRNLEIARDTLRHRNFDVVKGIITPVSDAYKKKDLVSIQHRVNMIQGAIRGSNWLELDSYEGFLPYFSTSVTILRYLREKWQQEYEEAQVRLVCGSDLILSFNVPNLWSNDDVFFFIIFYFYLNFNYLYETFTCYYYSIILLSPLLNLIFLNQNIITIIL